jgi:L-fucose mutarotase
VLTTTLIHPQILAVLAAAGHGSRILVADGHFPAATARGANAALVSLNLRPDLVTVTDTVATLVTAVPIEAATVMSPDDGREAPIVADVRGLLDCPITPCSRSAFYDEARSADVALVIQTADTRTFTNILLTIGVRADPARAT